MNRTNSLILAGIIIAGIIIAFAWSAVDDGDDNISNPSDVDIIGEWYQVYFEEYDQYGNYEVDQSSANLFDYTLAIFQTEGTSFIAEYNGDAVVGTYSSGIIQFNGWFGGEKIWFSGTFVDDSTMYATVVYQDRVDGHAAVSVYSTDMKAVETYPDWSVDISGDWVCKSAKQVSAETTYDLEGTDLTIEEQTNSVFYGTMQQNEGTEIVDNMICGSFAGTVAGDYRVGYVIDESLNVWTVLASGDQIIFHIADRSETEADLDSLAVVQRIYTRGGEATETVSTDISGTWYSGPVSYIDNDYYFGTEAISCILEIQMLDHGMIRGNFYQGSLSNDLFGYVYGDNPTYVNFNVDNDYNMMCYGYLQGDEMTVSFYSEVSGWYSTAASAVFVNNEPSALSEEDLVGYWYNVSTADSYSYSYGGKANPIFVNSYSYMLKNLIVTDVSDCMFHGWYDNEFIVGSYVNGYLDFIGYIGDTYVMMRGLCTSDDKITMVITTRDVDGKGGMSICLFAKEWYSYGGIANDELNYSGDWEGQYVVQYNGDVTDKDLEAGTLSLKYRGYNKYVGSMTQNVGGGVEEKLVWLFIYDRDGCGIMVDDTGITWSVNFSESGVVALSAVVSDGGELLGEVVAAERIYGETDFHPESTITGTWTSTSSKVMNIDGTVIDIEGITLKIGEMQGFLFSASERFGEENVNHAQVGYLETHGKSICLMSKDNPEIRGYGYIMDDGSMVLVQFMMSGEGESVMVSTLTSS